MAFNICLVRWLAMLASTAVLVLQHVAAQDTPAPAASSAADVTTVTVSANAFDDRTDDSGCTPNGCTAENTFDGDLTENSRWSCSAELVQAAGGAVGEECQIVYEFAEVQSVASVSVAFLKGDERTRTLAVNVNGELFEVIESGGITSGLEIFELGAGAGAPDVLTIGLESQGLAADEFLSIIEVELEVVVSVVAQPTGSPLTAAPAAMTATPITAVPVPATEVPATAVPTADVTPDTMSPVAFAVATPIPASVSIATPAPDLPSSTTTSARDLEITPSPSASGSAAGIGDSSGSETSPSGTTTGIWTGEVCFDYCWGDDECIECLEASGGQYATEFNACADEYETEGLELYCDALYKTFCCYDAVSPNDCLALESYVDYIECTLEYESCSIDDMACNHLSDWGAAPSPTADSTAAGSDSSSGGAPDPTPAPTLPLSSGTSARDLEITPTPAAGNVGASTSATSEGGTSTSDVVRPSSTGFSSTGSLCTDCYVDEQCTECIGFYEDREDAYYACLDSGELTSVCDAAFLPFCCSAAVSGNDCMANDAFVNFMQCIVEDADECSFEDMTCPGVIGLEIAGNDSGSDGATAVSWSTIVLNLTVGVLASVFMLEDATYGMGYSLTRT